MNASVKSFLRQAAAFVGVAMAILGAGAAHATVYEYSFSGVVNSASAYDAEGAASATAFGLSAGSFITGTLWLDSGATLDVVAGSSAYYSANLPALSITGLDLSALAPAAQYVASNNVSNASGQFDLFSAST